MPDTNEMNTIRFSLVLLFQVCLCLGFPRKEINSTVPSEFSTRSYELQLRRNEIQFTAAYSIQFVRINRNLFLVENTTCVNLDTKETLDCRSSRGENNLQTLSVNLDGIPNVQQVSLVYGLQNTFDEIRVYVCLLRPNAFNLSFVKINLKVTDQFQLGLRVLGDTAAITEVTANHNELLICPNSSEVEHSSNCTNSTTSGIDSEMHFNADISENMHQNLSIQINGVAVFAHLFVSEGLGSLASDILEERPSTNTTLNGTRPGSILSPVSWQFCVWQFALETTVRTLFHGPCSEIRNVFPESQNSTHLTAIPPTRETVARDNFMYHELDKAESLTNGVFYWIIDTRKVTIENFWCLGASSPICSSKNASNPCEFIHKDNMAIFYHHVHAATDCSAIVSCILNGKYISTKDIAFSDSTNGTTTDEADTFTF